MILLFPTLTTVYESSENMNIKMKLKMSFIHSFIQRQPILLKEFGQENLSSIQLKRFFQGRSQRGVHIHASQNRREQDYIYLYTKGKCYRVLCIEDILGKKEKKTETRNEKEQVLCLISWAPDMTQQTSRSPAL